jgi:hypothetical protein
MVSRPADRLLSPGAHRPMTTPPPTATKPRAEPESPVSMIVRDVEMGFGSMVVFIIKWTLASIPALIILSSSAWCSRACSAASSPACEADASHALRAPLA